MVSIRSIITSAVAILAVPATSQPIIYKLGPLMAKTTLIFAPASSISILNGPLIAVNQGPFPEIIAGYTDIVNSTDLATQDIDGLLILDEGGDVPQDIVDYYWLFVRSQQSLLDLLRDKAAPFTLVPLIGQPVTDILRDAQRATDALGGKLADAIDGSYGSLNAQIVSDRALLNSAYTRAITSYSGLIGLRKREDDNVKLVRGRGFIA